MKSPAPIIHTKRLLLREIAQEDTDLIVKWRSDPCVYRFFLAPHPLEKEEHLAWFSQRYQQDETRYDFIAEENRSSVPVGVFGIKRWQETSPTVEVSYLVAPECQRNGYATEVVEALLQWAAEIWKSQTAVAEIHCENTASKMLAKKMGFHELSQNGNFIIYKRDL